MFFLQKNASCRRNVVHVGKANGDEGVHGGDCVDVDDARLVMVMRLVNSYRTDVDRASTRVFVRDSTLASHTWSASSQHLAPHAAAPNK